MVSTTIPPATGPNKAPNDQIKLNVAEIRPCVFTSFAWPWALDKIRLL